ncbi:MAG: polyhydroxybutyrate depolymerase [Parcubacteria group bacterium Gr01-1014_33]|nr:MAG: polyhydroxybutyrate depolymerase [Parcubacteria group bacterium Gr01-1014_33]
MKLNRYYLFLMAGAVFFASAHAFVVQAQTLPRGERLRQIIEERRASGQPMLQNVAQAKVFFRRLFSLQKEALGNIRQKISSREKLPAEIKAQLLALFDARIAEVEGQAKELEAITSVQALPLFVQGLKTSRDTFRTEVRSILSPYLSSKGFRLIDELKEREALLKEKLTELKRRGVDTSRIEERLVRANDHLKRAEELLRGGSFADNGSNVSALAQGIGSGGRVWRYAAAVFKEMASALGKATREFKSVLALINGEIIGSAQAALLTATLTLTIKPSITDPAIGDANGDHMVFLPSVFPQQGKLFVFFPGTGGMPKHTTYINQTAASVGYHAIDLAYINDLSAKQGCARSPNPNCKENMRMEIITGTDTSPVVDVNRANSIENRLIKLLEYLIRTRPAAEGWGAFVSSSNVRWDLVVAAGHSQGAGHAAMLGKTRLLDRAVMFAGTEPAAWTTEPFITPAERFYGFVHTADPLSYPESVTSWQNIGLPGTETSVDNATPPFNNAHKLLTSSARRECSGGNAHGCILTDPKTPLDAQGVPIFQEVWKYLIGSGYDDPTEIALTASLNESGTITVNWSNVSNPSPTDWISIYQPTTPDKEYDTERWFYTSSCTESPGSAGKSAGSCTMTMPTTPGTYELRLFTNGTWVRIATSLPITVNRLLSPMFTLSPSSTVLGLNGKGALQPVYDSDGSGSEVEQYPVASVVAREVRFTSSNPAVVTVDAQGELTARGQGTATITATYKGMSAQTQVKVSGKVESYNFQTPDDRTRSYLLYIPSRYIAGTLTPLILSFHGGGGNAQGEMDSTLTNVLADQEGFLVAYPQGTGLLPKVNTWNGGSCCGYASDNKVDDVKFVSMLIDHVAARFSIDPKKVYATGMSNGGIISHRLACQLSDKIAAIAPVGGGLNVGGDFTSCTPSRKVSVMHFHGTTDVNYLYNGGIGEGPSQTNFHSIPATIDDWVGLNSLSGVSARTTYQRGIETCETRSDTSAEVTLCTARPTQPLRIGEIVYDGGGHAIPGGIRNPGSEDADVPTQDISSNAAMWEFFKKHPLTARPQTFTLTTSVIGSGRVTGTGIDCGTDCTEQYISGTSVPLTVTPSTGYTFSGWSGACSGTQTTCRITMDGNKNVGAEFISIGACSPQKAALYLDSFEAKARDFNISIPQNSRLLGCDQRNRANSQYQDELPSNLSSYDGVVIYNAVGTHSKNTINIPADKPFFIFLTEPAGGSKMDLNYQGQQTSGSVVTFGTKLSNNIVDMQNPPKGMRYVFDDSRGLGITVADTNCDNYRINGIAINRNWSVRCEGVSAGSQTPTPSLSVSLITVSTGGSVTASWSDVNNPSPADWISVYKSTTPNEQYDTTLWLYTSNCTQSSNTSVRRSSGSCPFLMPTTPGTYELRLFSDDGYERLATSLSITVE